MSDLDGLFCFLALFNYKSENSFHSGDFNQLKAGLACVVAIQKF